MNGKITKRLSLITAQADLSTAQWSDYGASLKRAKLYVQEVFGVQRVRMVQVVYWNGNYAVWVGLDSNSTRIDFFCPVSTSAMVTLVALI